MRKDVLCLVLSASLVCGMMPMGGWAQKASAAGGDSSDGIEVFSDGAGVSKQDDAAGGEATASGTFGGTVGADGIVEKEDTHQWSFAADVGVLTISGEGQMPDYNNTTYVDAPWYAYKDQIKKVIFQGNVTSVGSYAFYKYDKLEEVDITGAKTLTEVGASSFESAAALRSLVGQEAIQTLGDDSFYGCAFETISMPDVAMLPKNCFRVCPNLTSVDFPKVTTTGKWALSGNDALVKVNLPQVLEFSEGTLRGCPALESISLPELTTISGGKCFENCSSLRTISLPKLKEIDGTRAFASCSSLERLDLPELTELVGSGELALECHSLISANLPKVSTQGTYSEQNKARGALFKNCYSLVYVDISSMADLSATYPMFNGNNNLKRIYMKGEALSGNISSTVFNTIKSEPVIYVGSDEVKTKFKNYSNQDNIKVANDFEALKGKETSLRISQADYDNDAPAEPTLEGKAEGATVVYRYYTDVACTVLADTENPGQKPTVAGVYYVRAFADAVGEAYFATSSNQAGFTVYGEIQGEGFTYHNKNCVLTITNATVMDTDYNGASGTPWKDYYKNVGKIVVKEGVELTKIAKNAFVDMKAMTEFDLPDTVTSIGEAAFKNCEAWEAENVLTDKVTSVGVQAFYGCKKISGTMTLNEGITEIPQSLFYGCESVGKIQYNPEVITSYGTDCFRNTGVTELPLAANTTAIPQGFYTDCKNIVSVTIPAGVTEIPDDCFSGCGLKEFVIPNTITSLGVRSFYGCRNLIKIAIPNSVKTIGESCFHSSGIAEITFPDTAITMGRNMLGATPNLESIEIPEWMESLPEGMFQYSGLKKVIVPDTVTLVGLNAFQGCEQLEYLELLSDNYTEETFGTQYSTTTVNGEQIRYSTCFNALPRNAMVVCDGATYELLKGYGTYWYNDANGWLAEEILYKRSEILDQLSAEYVKVKEQAAALVEADYDAELWAAFQTALTEADALSGVGDTTYDKIQNRIAARKSIAVAAKPFLRSTCQKAAALLESDYDTEGDGADAWYAYLDAREVATAALQNEDIEFSEVMACDKNLRKAMAEIVPLPADGAKTELNQVVGSAESMNAADYTPESWAALQEAIKEAKGIVNTAATISQVEAAKKKVNDAIAALVKVSASDPSGNPSVQPSTKPTEKPSAAPSTKPTEKPSAAPSTKPTEKPSAKPTEKPGGIQPTKKPDGSIETPQKVTVKKVTLKKVKSTKKKVITVQWKKLAGVTGYQVQIGTNKKVTKGKKTYTVKKAKTVKKTIKKLKRKKKYYVRVRAYKTVKGKKYYGKWSKIKAVKVK